MLSARCELAKATVEWLHMKWILRCNMAEKPESTREFERVMKRGEELWSTRSEMELLDKDRYLLTDRNDPRLMKRMDYIKCWTESVLTVVQECGESRPKGQTTLTKWVQRTRRQED